MGPAATTLLANTYTGGTTIQGGSLVVGSDTSLGTGSVTNGATLATAAGQHVIHVGGGDLRQGDPRWNHRHPQRGSVLGSRSSIRLTSLKGSKET